MGPMEETVERANNLGGLGPGPDGTAGTGQYMEFANFARSNPEDGAHPGYPIGVHNHSLLVRAMHSTHILHVTPSTGCLPMVRVACAPGAAQNEVQDLSPRYMFIEPLPPMEYLTPPCIAVRR